MSGDQTAKPARRFAPVGRFGVPFTLVFLIVMVAANFLAGTFDGALPDQALQKWGIGHDSVAQGDFYRLITGVFLSHDLGMLARQFCFVALVIGFYEWTQGTWRAACMFVSIDVLGTLIVLFVILLPLNDGPVDALNGIISVHDVGMSAGGFGLIGAIIAMWRGRIWLLFAVLASIAIKVWVQFDPIADIAHSVTVLMGFGAQYFLFERSDKSAS